MIQEMAIFIMGFSLASLVRQAKVVYITQSYKKQIKEDIDEAESMQKEFIEKGDSTELAEKQAASVSKLGKHVGREEILKKFNYIIW